jgi:glutathione-regulated potassium-efflux system protein KefB
MARRRTTSRWLSIGIGLGRVAALVAAGRWLLNPMFRILARCRRAR